MQVCKNTRSNSHHGFCCSHNYWNRRKSTNHTSNIQRSIVILMKNIYFYGALDGLSSTPSCRDAGGDASKLEFGVRSF